MCAHLSKKGKNVKAWTEQCIKRDIFKPLTIVLQARVVVNVSSGFIVIVHAVDLLRNPIKIKTSPNLAD